MKTTYSERLKDPQWQRQRLEVMQRDDWRCCVCGRADQSLNVHHLFYLRGRKPWEYPQAALQTLCEPCHEERQEITDKIFQAIGLCLRDLPTKRMQSVASSIFQEAMTRL